MLPLAAMGLAGGVMAGIAGLRPAPVSDDDDSSVPLPGVGRQEWINFIKSVINGNVRTVTPSYRLGAFEMTVRRLCDLGAMRNPRTVVQNGRQVWEADWHSPSTLAEFLSDAMAQYQLFTTSMQRYYNVPEIHSLVGTEVDGVICTLSGLLAVAHRAGFEGMTQWVSTPVQRVRFQVTKAHFGKSNGLF